MPSVKLNKTYANKATICFEIGISLSSISIVRIDIPVGTANFHVVETSIPFLLYLKDIDTLGIYLNNITNHLICEDGKSVFILCKWRHPWFFVNNYNKIATGIFLTKVELYWVYTCFGYPSVNKLHKLLTQTGHDTGHKTIKIINKFCHYCQIKGEVPQRLKFTLKKNVDFNYKIIVDIMYQNRKPIFHAVDTATAFQANRFSNNKLAKKT